MVLKYLEKLNILYLVIKCKTCNDDVTVCSSFIDSVDIQHSYSTKTALLFNT